MFLLMVSFGLMPISIGWLSGFQHRRCTTTSPNGLEESRWRRHGDVAAVVMAAVVVKSGFKIGDPEMLKNSFDTKLIIGGWFTRRFDLRVFFYLFGLRPG